MTDRPRFDVDDTTSSYSPPPSTRPKWVDQGWGAGSGAAATGQSGVTPGTGGVPVAGTPTWYDPAWQTGRESSGGRSGRPPVPPAPPSARRGPGMLAIAAVALLSGVVGAALTVGALGAGGYLVKGGAGPAASVERTAVANQ